MSNDSALLPVKNKFALIGYYLGMAGFFPIIGLPLSISAFILGIMGLDYDKKIHVPGAKAHSVIAIVLGLVLASIHLSLILFWLLLITADFGGE